MKKLMILMAAVATSAFALGADSLKNVFDATTASNLTGWHVPEGDGKAVLANGVLTLATGSDIASRLVKADGTPLLMADNQELYFDVSLDVLGQALDEVPTLPDDAKLALFLLDTTEIDGAPNGTNLYALAQSPTEPDAKVLVRFGMGEESLLSGKSRLTVKTYKNVLKDGLNSGFTVYQNGGILSGKVKPLMIYSLYSIDETGAVDWKDTFNSNTYMSNRLISSLEMNRSCVLLGLKSGVSGQSFTALDFVGNAKVSSVEINDSGFDFIAPDEIITKITCEGVTISVVMDDGETGSYDSETGIITGSCTITVTPNDGCPIFTPPAHDFLKAVDGQKNTFKYTYAPGNNVTFEAYAVGATVEIGDETTQYAKLSEALDAIASAGESAVKVTLFNSETIEVLMTVGRATIDLHGQTLTGTGSDYGAVIYVTAGNATIWDSVGGGAVVAREANVGTVLCESGATVAITGGRFEGAVKDSNEGDVVGVSIAGGSFSVEPDDRLIAKGYVATKGEDGYWTVAKSGSPAEVVDPSTGPVVVDTEGAADALTISATSPDADVVTDAEYTGYFKKVVTETTDGKFSVAAVLDETVVNAEAVAAELASKFDQITDAGVEVAAKPGLFYSVEQGQTLGAMTEGERVMATSTTVRLKATKYSGSGFYKILVNTSDKK